MSDHVTFCEAHFPEPFVCMGERLKPLSLGHVLLLKRMQSPFILGNKIPELSDLLLAVYICSNDHYEAWIGLKSGMIQETLDRINKRFNGSEDQAITDIPFMLSYIKIGMRGPKYIVTERNTDGKSTGLDNEQWIELMAVSKVGLYRDEILSMPYCLLQHYVLSHLAIEGVIKLWDESDEKAEAERIAFEEKMKTENSDFYKTFVTGEALRTNE